jgi:chromosome segregation ATPase
MSDEELVKRPLDEEFDTMMEVQRDPYGAWQAIQTLTEQLEAARADAKEAEAYAEELEGDLTELCRQLLAAEDKLAKAVEAAKPLAAMAERYDPEDDDGDLECWSGLAVPKIKHIRALRTAIADIKIECQE